MKIYWIIQALFITWFKSITQFKYYKFFLELFFPESNVVHGSCLIWLKSYNCILLLYVQNLIMNISLFDSLYGKSVFSTTECIYDTINSTWISSNWPYQTVIFCQKKPTTQKEHNLQTCAWILQNACNHRSCSLSHWSSVCDICIHVCSWHHGGHAMINNMTFWCIILKRTNMNS